MESTNYVEIKKALERAAYVDRLLPPVHAPKYRCCMPDIVYTAQEIAFMERCPIKPKPTQEQIALWEKVVLEWMPLLTLDERRLVWKRANKIPWKLLCREFGMCKSNLAERYSKALIKIFFFVKGKKMS